MYTHTARICVHVYTHYKQLHIDMYIYAYMHTCIHTCIDTCMHMHTQISDLLQDGSMYKLEELCCEVSKGFISLGS